MLLIVTERFDPHVDFVEPVLDERGIPWRRFHLGDFPMRMSASCQIDDGDFSGSLQLNGEPIALEDILAERCRPRLGGKHRRGVGSGRRQ